MPSLSFSYDVQGLSYTIVVIQDGDSFRAEITVNSGQMDVNALYLADSDHSDSSASLAGPLNMNGGGAQFEGESVQWDQAIPLSQPGLGGNGSGKETFLTEGETLTVPLNIDSLDEVAFIGIRATSTSTQEGSIKAVTPPDDDHEDDDCDDDDDHNDDDCECVVDRPEETGEIPDGTAYMQFYVDPDVGNREYVNITLPDDGEPHTFDDYWAALLESDIVSNLDCDWSLGKAIAWEPNLDPNTYGDYAYIGTTVYLAPEDASMPLPTILADPEDVAFDEDTEDDMVGMLF